MHSLRFAIPSLFTLGNASCGFLGIYFALNGNLISAFYMILLAAFLDFWDGFLARKLGVDGEMGKQLDSLADVITFGALPAFIVFSWMKQVGVFIEFLKPYSQYLPYFAIVILLSSIWRLAKFNIDTEQSSYFRGLATPASAILIGSLAHSFEAKGFYYPFMWFNEASILFVILLSWFLNSRIRLLSLKFSHYRFPENKYRYLLILFSLLSVFFYSFEAVPLVLVIYIGISFIHFKTGHEI